MHTYRSFAILLSCLLFVHQRSYATTFDSMRSFFGGTPYQDVVDKDYLLDAHGLISLQNIEGSITIRPGLDKRTVALRATKYTSNQEHLEHMHVIEEEVTSKKLALRSAYDYEKVKGRIDYVLTVPETISLRLSTQHGVVHVTGIKGDITITVGKGDVTIIAPEGTVNATITQQGDMVIIDPKKAVHATVYKGALYVNDSQADVIGKLQHGDIQVQAKLLPAQTTISLVNQQGDIKLKLPKQIETEIHATTERGVITSQQILTLLEQQTQLDGTYWQGVKKNIHAKIGARPKARVELHCKQGNIRLQER